MSQTCIGWKLENNKTDFNGNRNININFFSNLKKNTRTISWLIQTVEVNWVCIQ